MMNYLNGFKRPCKEHEYVRWKADPLGLRCVQCGTARTLTNEVRKKYPYLESITQDKD